MNDNLFNSSIHDENTGSVESPAAAESPDEQNTQAASPEIPDDETQAQAQSAPEVTSGYPTPPADTG